MTNQSTRTKLDFPTPRSRNAPKTFTGRYDEVGSFIKEFEVLADAYNLSNDDRFELVTRYVKRSIREIIEGLEEYHKKDWKKFADNLRKLFDHDRTEKRFKEKDLQKFISKTRNGRITRLYDFHKYQRKFTRIGGWLHQKNKISDVEYRKYFWKGLPKSTRRKLEERMLQEDPKLSRSTPFLIDTIISAAEHVYDVSRFYDDDSDSSDSSSSEDSDTDVDAQSTEEDENAESKDEDASSDEDDDRRRANGVSKRKGKKKRSGTEVKKRDRHQLGGVSSPTTPPSSSSTHVNPDEVADLIDKLGRLNLNDPSYAALYFRIISKAPNTASFLTKPRPRTFEAGPRTNASTASGNQPFNNGPLECFFCGEQGHGIRRCTQADAMIQAGTIMRSQDGRLMWPDGSNILRSGAESLLSSINRELAFRSRVNVERPPTTNLIYDFRYQHDDDNDSDSDEEDYSGKVYATEVYPVARPRQEHRAGRLKKVKFDGVYPPPLDRSHKKEDDGATEDYPIKKASTPKLPRTNTPAPKPTPEPAQLPVPEPVHLYDPIPAMAPSSIRSPQVSPPTVSAQHPMQVPVPVPSMGPSVVPHDPALLPFDPNDDDQIMEDVSDNPTTQPPTSKATPKPRMTTKKPSGTNAKLPKPIRTIPKILPKPSILTPTAGKLQSQCFKEFDADQFFKKICNTPITITVGEALGSSPTMAKRMREYLQLTRVPQANNLSELTTNNPSDITLTNSISRSANYHPNDARLISIRMNFDNDVTVDTLIDCGSELDIINKHTCIKSQIPIDASLTTYMRDAGLHDTLMEGRCHNVNLTAGNLVTTTDLWVGKKVPFSLLLGRPWQRRNRISIDERETGTWLCRRDPSDRKIWETCVVPAKHAEEFFNSFQSHFFGKNHHSPDTFLAQMTKDPYLSGEMDTEDDDT